MGLPSIRRARRIDEQTGTASAEVIMHAGPLLLVSLGVWPRKKQRTCAAGLLQSPIGRLSQGRGS
ncbi:hypothetical protein MES4922_40174 [Mesorhizobium ventifaucium]|uniref:Uncharacterized protein n=1 Tax=Mesorhizobium ventifaucium TaxID=666020 RepID=A0ABN8K731_9HYPH|nr:hypothetical protein MES4922_40174 [Mesorhizobium ventifaucium]